MLTMTAKVLRWTALGAGLVWGFQKQSTITARDKAAEEKAEYDRKARLISQAKQEWQRRHAPPPSASPAASSSSSELLHFNLASTAL